MAIGVGSTTNARRLFVLIFVLSFLIAGAGSAQTPARPAATPPPPKPARPASAPMVRIHAGTFSVGIDSDQIPRFQKIFGIDSPELFRDEVPKHQITIDDYYIDQFPVTNAQFRRFTDANPEWQPNRINRALDNGNYLKHWNDPATFTT